MQHENTPYTNPEQQADSLPALGSELSSRNMFCLHGIALDSVGRNSIVPESTRLKERFQIAIERRPALSVVVHTEKATSSKASLWSTVGVVIGDGKIQAASPRDMSSVMLEGGRRRVQEQSTDEVMEALNKIAANDTKYPDDPPHNELVVSDPVVAGLYFKDTAGLMDFQINRQQTVANPNTIPELIRELGAQFNIPIFAVRTSGVYKVQEYDPETGKYQFSNEMAPRVHANEVVQNRINLPDTTTFAGTIALAESRL